MSYLATWLHQAITLKVLIYNIPGQKYTFAFGLLFTNSFHYSKPGPNMLKILQIITSSTSQKVNH